MPRTSLALALLALLTAAGATATAGQAYLYAHEPTGAFTPEVGARVVYFTLDKKTGIPSVHPSQAINVKGGNVNIGTVNPNDDTFTSTRNHQLITADPKGEFIFVGTETGLGVFRRDRKTGRLSHAGGSPYEPLGGGQVRSLAAFRKGKSLRVYAVTNDTVGNTRIREFAIDTEDGNTNGAATEVGSAVPGLPPSLAEPFYTGAIASKRHLFVLHPENGVYVYDINKKTGALSTVLNSPFSFAGITDLPFNVQLDRKGRTLALNSRSGGTYGFADIEKKTSQLVALRAVSSSAPVTTTIAFDRKGKKFYGSVTDGVEVFDPEGSLLQMVPSVVPTGVGALGPKGRNLYMASGKDLLHYRIEKKTGAPGGAPDTALVGAFESFVGVQGMIIIK